MHCVLTMNTALPFKLSTFGFQNPTDLIVSNNKKKHTAKLLNFPITVRLTFPNTSTISKRTFKKISLSPSNSITKDLKGKAEKEIKIYFYFSAVTPLTSPTWWCSLASEESKKLGESVLVEERIFKKKAEDV